MKTLLNQTIITWPMKPVLVLLFALVFVVHSHAQPGEGKVIDEVVAVVGGNMIRFSDIENQYMQFRLQGNIEGARSMRCQILENMLFQKLLINQAVLDSVEVTDAQVESEMDRKLRYFISQIGSREKLEAYYKKSIPEIKEEFRDAIRDQLIVETMQGNITRDIKVTPSEVKRYYQTIPEDSLPLINSEVEIGQIVKKPPMSPEEKAGARSRLADFRKRILGGESFAALAALYSEDPGSTAKG
ncbi:MAG: SurA N-terminal domain-containing protein, partial [Bacteroidales bacterium]|nr:SurA N-terminal domain-containing protein [Bacteroidales bacterium]